VARLFKLLKNPLILSAMSQFPYMFMDVSTIQWPLGHGHHPTG